ncbi:phosphoglucosamine mutase [Slackia faecicanis]|uniref:Phosphoglucosamine mutase n=1 Tax=Slackia faecicanis TaxID=255723 RepID=A0A3N0AGI3_9ACTN|nr:phosphoglucosamine mutase [Slackia faecicanis]MDO5358881.1 phosphoglucosamine mutase [Slackia faecicanis]RNL20893.1 phosphoglucosamine mutase [Slackia faecicanis]
MARLFGTDGVRGVANVDLTCEMAYRLGQAAVAFMGATVVLGKDTRKSGDMLEAAVVAGITSAGGDALLAGVIPTPAVALLTRELHADGGIVISASHNPPEYNGIKFFDGQGFKLPDAVEDDIEKFIVEGGLEGVVARAVEAGEEACMPAGSMVGVAVEVEDACEMYVDHVVRSIQAQGIDFSGLHVALDTGHGASSLTSAEALRRLGAEVTVINDDFDGNDINVGCGSTNLGPLRELMAESGADVGIAHDGDADRVMMLAADGSEIDGDVMEAVLAVDLKERGCLPGNVAVSTVMTNLGFVRAMRAAGIEVLQTKVGDRYVLEAMREGGYALGGEQSGHMILLEHNSTGDGLMTACQFLAAVRRSGKPVEEAITVMTRFPQTLINVRVQDKHALDGNEAIWGAVRAAEEAMGDAGRVLVRTSGTEPLVRVMVEAETQDVADGHARAIADVVEAELA